MGRLGFFEPCHPATDRGRFPSTTSAGACAQGTGAVVPGVDRTVFPLRSSLHSERDLWIFPLRDVWRRPDHSGVRLDGPVHARTRAMTGHHHGRGRGGFIEHTIQGLHAAMEQALYAEHSANAGGLLQRLDPRVKVAALSAFILVSAVTAKLWVVATVLLVAVILAALSKISLRVLATRVWLTTLTLSGALALPAVFLTPGA